MPKQLQVSSARLEGAWKLDHRDDCCRNGHHHLRHSIFTQAAGVSPVPVQLTTAHPRCLRWAVTINCGMLKKKFPKIVECLSQNERWWSEVGVWGWVLHKASKYCHSHLADSVHFPSHRVATTMATHHQHTFIGQAMANGQKPILLAKPCTFTTFRALTQCKTSPVMICTRTSKTSVPSLPRVVVVAKNTKLIRLNNCSYCSMI